MSRLSSGLIRRRSERRHRSQRPLDYCIILAGNLVLEGNRQRLVLVFDVRSHVVQVIHRVVAVAAQKVVVLVEVDYDL